MARAREDEPRRRALVVLGMHRSGTSAVARLMMLLGADAPKRLMPPDSSNVTGHWEPVWMTRLHDEIFRSVSSWWDDIDHLPASWFESATAQRFRERAVELLRKDYGDSRLFVIKDPRISRTVPFWRSVFAEYGAKPSYVILVRHPMEIASSLKVRDGMTPSRALLLYLRDTLAVELETRDSPRVFVSYEQTLSDWRSVAQQISEKLNITWPRLTQRAAVEIERFLSPKHRHHLATGEDLSARPDVIDWVKQLHSILEEAAESGAEPDLEGLDAISARLEEADRAYGPVLAEAELDVRAKGKELDEAAAEIEWLSEAAENLGDWAEDLQRSWSWRITRPLRAIRGLGRRALGRPRPREKPPAMPRPAARSPRPAPSDAEAPSPARVPANARGERADRQRRSDTRRLIAWIEHLERSRSWRITKPLRALGQLARGRRPQKRGDLGGLSDAELRQWIRELEGSRSWRITWPLRALASLARRVLRRPVRQPEPPPVSRAARTPEEPVRDAARVPGARPRKRAPEPAPPASLTLARQIRSRERPPEEMEQAAQRPAGELVDQLGAAASPSPAFEEFDPEIARDRERQAKLIAFYLPQFHSIPENDTWWGKGFNDWRNVVRGTPRFSGHYQPRIPRDLGFYDLRDPETIRRQTDLARSAGLHGFAFYYFSFSGRRLLDQPLEQFLADRSIDFPFCVTWANENWTRRWDGLEEEALLRQDHTPDDDASLVDDLQRHFEDPRYIRIQGRPLFLVYRFDVITNAGEAVARWRELSRDRHGEDPLILMVQSFEDDPRPYGADGAVEFPPQRLARWDNAIRKELHFFDPKFTGYVIDYESLANTAIRKEAPPFTWARGITPCWDNDARRQGAGTILHGSTPALYERWLASLVQGAHENPVLGEPLVFINAWNEWAEGAYLEPDVHYGGAYLNATARAVCREKGASPIAIPDKADESRAPEKTRVLLVGHDAHPHGAQMNLRALGDRLKHQFGCKVAYLLMEGGRLTADYREQGEVHVCEDPDRVGPIVRQLRRRGYAHAVVNTLAAAAAVGPLKEAGFGVVSLVSELPRTITAEGLEDAAGVIAEQSNKVVFPAAMVSEAFSEFAEVPPGRTAIQPQGLFREGRSPSPSAVEKLRRNLHIPRDARVVLNVGYADQRKGIDIFLETARRAVADAPDLHFVWLGNLNAEALELRAEVESSGAKNIHFARFTEEVSPYLKLADVFFLSSREDPFPSVVLEAMDAGLPIVAFRGSGGTESLAAEHGALVAAEDLADALAALQRCASEDDPAAAEARRQLVNEKHQYDTWAFEILCMLEPRLKKVSVVVPNFNYAEHLDERLESIFEQTHPIFELIVLDDGSTDRSVSQLAEIQHRTGRRFRVITGGEKSKSLFEQWSRASELARGDYLWIAEADDLCKPAFLERLMRDMHEGVAFAFSDSAQIDETGLPLEDSYKEYYERSANGVMGADFVLNGDQFVRSCLLERNLVLNVSAVTWNLHSLREALDRCLDELLGYQLAGDWHLYAATALSGKRVAYVSEPLSIHRRHENGVTDSLDREQHIEEVRRVHSKLRDWLSTDADERARMERYEAELESQFGLTP
jgi:glycosyltransferase involved in cell wall biosynthesis